MSSHHDHHDSHVNESKPVAFRTPLILALVTVLLILLAVSTCDGHHKSACECKEDCSEECMKKCESGDHSGHHSQSADSHSTEEAHNDSHETTETEHVSQDTLSAVTNAVDTVSSAVKEHAPASH